MGTSSVRHTRRTARMSSSDSANATARGSTAHGLASVEYVRRLASSVRTFSGPIASSKDRRRVESSVEPVIRTTHERERLTCPFRRRVSPKAGTTFMARSAFDDWRAHQSGSPPKDDGARADRVPGSGVPHAVGPRLGDREPNLADLQGPADADLCDDAAAPRERARADPSRDPAPIQGRAVRDVPAGPRGRPALAGEANRLGIGNARTRVRDQRRAGTGITRPVRSDLRTEERAGATPPYVRRSDAGGDRHRDDEEPGTDPRRLHARPRRQGETRSSPEVRLLLHAGQSGRRAGAPETRGGAPHRLHDARLHARVRRKGIPDEPSDPG